MSRLANPIVLVALVGSLAAGLWYVQRHKNVPAPAHQTTLPSPHKAGQTSLKSGFDAKPVDQSWQAPTSTPAAPKAPEPFYGHTPETPRELLESSEQAQSNLAALRDPKQFPHRLTSMITEKSAFDFNRWENDPAFRKAYLAESVPLILARFTSIRS
jgi:hypothetical protein